MSEGYAGKRFKDQSAAERPVGAAPAHNQSVRMMPAGGHFAKPAQGGAAAEGRVSGAQPAPNAAPAPNVAPAGRRFKVPAAEPVSSARVVTGPSMSAAAPHVVPRRVPSPADTFANLTAADLDESAAAVTAMTPVPRATETTSKLQEGSAIITPPAPSETAEFIALASAARAARADAAASREPIGRASAVPVVNRAPASVTPPPQPPHGPRQVSPAGRDGGGEPPRGRGRNILSTVLIVVGVALLLAAAGIFIKAQIGYQEAQSSYDDLKQYAVQDSAGDKIPSVDFDELERINPDVVGWIYVPDTPISYPVVQTNDNSTYLYKLFDLSGNGSGSIFMDKDAAAPGVVDQQTTLYGHHMNDGSMFKVIDDTLKQENFDKITRVYYITRENTYKFTPLFTAQVQDDHVTARQTNFTQSPTFMEYLEESLAMAKASAPDAAERIASTDKVISLVTCAGEIIPRTTRAVMVCSLDQVIDRQ